MLKAFPRHWQEEVFYFFEGGEYGALSMKEIIL